MRKSRTSSSPLISRRGNASASRRHFRRSSKSLAKTFKSGSHRLVAPRSRIHRKRYAPIAKVWRIEPLRSRFFQPACIMRACSLSPYHREHRMKVVLLIGALCGILYQTSAIAKDQDGIVIFGQGILGCAKNHVVTTTNNEMHVKCNLGSNTVVDFNRKISATCSGIIEGTWRRAPDKISYTNINIDNNHFICRRTTYSPKFEFDRLATADLTLHGFSGSPAAILMTYDVLSAQIQICVVPYSDMEMVCFPEMTPPSK